MLISLTKFIGNRKEVLSFRRTYFLIFYPSEQVSIVQPISHYGMGRSLADSSLTSLNVGRV